jgi:uncharacterized protein YndB with AHSA1/START domain
MSAGKITHGTFTIEKVYDASLRRVFGAWADREIRARWFSCPQEVEELERSHDFRAGGSEVLEARWPTGMVSRFDASYREVAPDERIVYLYDMRIDGQLISVSLVTVELSAEGARTRLKFTEQGAYREGWDDIQERKAGNGEHLDNLANVLAREAA